MKILIIRLSSLGDIVLTEPVVRFLKQYYPDAQIDYLTKPAFLGIVSLIDGIDTIHLWEGKKKILLKKLSLEKYDLLLDLHSKLNTFIIKLFVSARKTITYKKKHFLRRKIVQHTTDQTIDSTLDLYLSVLRRLHIPCEITPPRFKDLSIIFDHEPLCTDPAKKLIGIFPGATHKTKQFPPEKIADLIDSFPHDFEVILLGNKDEIPLSKFIENKAQSHVSNRTGEFSLLQLIEIMKKLDVVITNDSGPMHLAAALDKPQLAIFGATHPRLGFRPLSAKAIIACADLPCQPCSLHGGKLCPKDDFECMYSLDIGHIRDAVILLAESPLIATEINLK